MLTIIISDLLWGYLQGVKVPGISPRFDLLFRVAETIPHSNAGEERMFSYISKKKKKKKKKKLAEVHCNLMAHYLL